MFPELMKNPNCLLSASSTVTGLRVTLKGFWLSLNCRVMGELSVPEPSSIVKSDSSKLISSAGGII